MSQYLQNFEVICGLQGAVSVSMSINQTFFCFICTHLTAGEREVDQIKRNADVHEIHKRTVFHSVSALGLPKLIYDHESVFYLASANFVTCFYFDLSNFTCVFTSLQKNNLVRRSQL